MLDVINLKKFFLEIKKKIFNLNLLNFGRIFNIPNILTCVRIIFIIPLSINLLCENYIKAFEILIFSGLTDFLDGFFARILNKQTKLGEILDPIADKLTLISIMTCLSIKFSNILYFMIILIIKELCMLIAGAFMLQKTKKTIRAKWYGKLATVFFYFSVGFIVSIKALWGVENKFLVNILMFLTTLLMLYAMLKYLLEFLSIIYDRKRTDN